MRSLVFRFVDIAAFSVALDGGHGSLPLPDGESVLDGEWVLAIFEIGSRKRATAAAARGVRAAGDDHLEFERRDWDRLNAFVAARSEHMRAARPVTGVPVSSGRLPASQDFSIPELTDTREPPSADSRHPWTGVELPFSEAPPSSALDSSRVPMTARVLLVDDDERTRGEVTRMLADIGLSVEVVETATEASEKMMETAFDALVLDFNTRGEGMAPLDFVRGLRRDPQRAPLPVLFLSDRPSSRDVVDAFASGADDFLPKPFRAPELGARIFGLLRRARLSRAFAGGRA